MHLFSTFDKVHLFISRDDDDRIKKITLSWIRETLMHLQSRVRDRGVHNMDRGTNSANRHTYDAKTRGGWKEGVGGTREGTGVTAADSYAGRMPAIQVKVVLITPVNYKTISQRVPLLSSPLLCHEWPASRKIWSAILTFPRPRACSLEFFIAPPDLEHEDTKGTMIRYFFHH